MKKDDLIILLIAMLLLGAMLITIFFGGEKSRHGVGLLFEGKSEPGITVSTLGIKKHGLIQVKIFSIGLGVCKPHPASRTAS